MKYREDSVIYILESTKVKIEEMKDAAYLLNYIDQGYSTYLTAEEAEAGRQSGDAYDEPGKTRVIGFEIRPFVAKVSKRKKGRKE